LIVIGVPCNLGFRVIVMVITVHVGFFPKANDHT